MSGERKFYGLCSDAMIGLLSLRRKGCAFLAAIFGGAEHETKAQADGDVGHNLFECCRGGEGGEECDHVGGGR